MGREASLKQNVRKLLHSSNIHPCSIWMRCNDWTLKYCSYIQIITAWFHSPHNLNTIWKQALWWHDKYKMSDSGCTDIHSSVAINTPNLCQWKWCPCINNTWTRQLRGLLLARHPLPPPPETACSPGKEMVPEMSFKCAWRSSDCGVIWGRVERVLGNRNYPSI